MTTSERSMGTLRNENRQGESTRGTVTLAIAISHPSSECAHSPTHALRGAGDQWPDINDISFFTSLTAAARGRQV